MKLNSQNIYFIDQYLQKSDVIFVDVRAELTDHIATAVEDKMSLEDLDFYDAFKAYMVVHKKELLARNNSLFRPYLEGVSQFFRTLIQWYNLIILVLLVFCFQFLVNESNIINLNKTLFIAILFFGFCNTFFTYFVFKKRYLFLEKISFVLGLVYFISLIFNGFYDNFQGNSLTLGIVFFLFLAFVIHYFKTISQLKNQYR